jgi:hypothetical protein
MDTMQTVKQWQDDYFVLAKKVEVPVVQFTARVADAVAQYVPNRPSFMAEMPKFHELVESTLKFRTRLVNDQEHMVRQLVKAMDPVTMKFETTAPAMSTSKPAAAAAKAATTAATTAATAAKSAAKKTASTARTSARKVAPRRTVKAA